MGWIEVMDAEDLSAGEIATVELAMMDVAVWRSGSGRVVACDARCPHQWAHLGSVGVVDGEEIVCLSHGWRFDAEGEGSKLSAAGRRDPKSPVPMVAVREIDGRIELDLDEGVVAVQLPVRRLP